MEEGRLIRKKRQEQRVQEENVRRKDVAGDEEERRRRKKRANPFKEGDKKRVRKGRQREREITIRFDGIIHVGVSCLLKPQQTALQTLSITFQYTYITKCFISAPSTKTVISPACRPCNLMSFFPKHFSIILDHSSITGIIFQLLCMCCDL